MNQEGTLVKGLQTETHLLCVAELPRELEAGGADWLAWGAEALRSLGQVLLLRAPNGHTHRLSQCPEHTRYMGQADWHFGSVSICLTNLTCNVTVKVFFFFQEGCWLYIVCYLLLLHYEKNIFRAILVLVWTVANKVWKVINIFNIQINYHILIRLRGLVGSALDCGSEVRWFEPRLNQQSIVNPSQTSPHSLDRAKVTGELLLKKSTFWVMLILVRKVLEDLVQCMLCF